MDPLRILLVADPESDRLDPLVATLRHAGYELRLADPGEAESLLAEGPGEFDAVIRPSDPARVAPAPLDDAERRHIAVALRHTRGNKRQAAHLLGIARSTLLAKVRKYEL
jgi:transcriptional regulator of acetoin/glycerol metabolism